MRCLVANGIGNLALTIFPLDLFSALACAGDINDSRLGFGRNLTSGRRISDQSRAHRALFGVVSLSRHYRGEMACAFFAR